MPPAPDPMIGQAIARNRYQITARLGEGGMGFVYRAWDTNLGTEVVVKVPRRSLLDDPEFAERFTRETRALVELSHPNIVPIMEVGLHDGLPFFVMKYLAGGSLADRRTDGQGQPRCPNPRSLADWLPGVAAALDYAHSCGYIHRDVKPANILFGPTGHVYLSDFGAVKGLAGGRERRESTLTGTGMVLGTPEYMAPELIMGRPFDGRIDQYALAVVIYEMLGGRRPFEGPTPTAILVQQSTDEPQRISGLNPQVSEPLDFALHRALAKDPAQRFPDCAALARAVLGTLSAPIGASAATSPPGKVVKLPCGQCGTTLGVPADRRGKRTKCPVCGTRYRVSDRLDALEPIEAAEVNTGATIALAPIRPPARDGMTRPDLAAPFELSAPRPTPRSAVKATVREVVDRGPSGFSREDASRTPEPPKPGPKRMLIGGGIAAALLVLAGVAYALRPPGEGDGAVGAATTPVAKTPAPTAPPRIEPPAVLPAQPPASPFALATAPAAAPMPAAGSLAMGPSSRTLGPPVPRNPIAAEPNGPAEPGVNLTDSDGLGGGIGASQPSRRVTDLDSDPESNGPITDVALARLRESPGDYEGQLVHPTCYFEIQPAGDGPNGGSYQLLPRGLDSGPPQPLALDRPGAAEEALNLRVHDRLRPRMDRFFQGYNSRVKVRCYVTMLIQKTEQGWTGLVVHVAILFLQDLNNLYMATGRAVKDVIPRDAVPVYRLDTRRDKPEMEPGSSWSTRLDERERSIIKKKVNDDARSFRTQMQLNAARDTFSSSLRQGIQKSAADDAARAKWTQDFWGVPQRR